MLRRSIPITWFVICWTLLFQYETLRANYLSPLLHQRLPKIVLLFPPAGWIMFYNVARSYGFAEVYGIRGHEPTLLEPHDIFRTRAVGYDNIRRNVLVSVLESSHRDAFCHYLGWKFPTYDDFLVVYAEHPDLIDAPGEVLRQPVYRCQP